ncbi:MAG: hypothetical protein VKK98_09085 [Cyanobacteriota bacterium]|nr:hypothetical protein [Cyanobacteriota bacterium]
MERFNPNRNPNRRSKRFLGPEDLPHRGTHRPRRGQAYGADRELFAEGHWQAIRAQLEQQGWNPSQIDLLHEQLRQGWPLSMARQNVSSLSGSCPLKARVDP